MLRQRNLLRLPKCFGHWEEQDRPYEALECVHCKAEYPCMEQQTLNKMYERVC